MSDASKNLVQCLQKEVPDTPPQSGGKEAVNTSAACACRATSNQETAGSGEESNAKRARTDAS